mmetsp:Transcript_70266/g.111030  ORF Transcript_70266/g.111030 Transcript_70266/m.111030 type:complete len:184 (+) Transcript_70266:42-593(+)
MTVARVLATLAVGMPLLSLMGCSSKSSDKSECDFLGGEILQAAIKFCNGSDPKLLPTPSVTFEFVMLNSEPIEMSLNLSTSAAYKTKDKSAFTAAEKNWTFVHLDPLDGTSGNPICVKTDQKAGIVIRDDFSCPSCAHTDDTATVWMLGMSSTMSLSPCHLDAVRTPPVAALKKNSTQNLMLA